MRFYARKCAAKKLRGKTSTNTKTAPKPCNQDLEAVPITSPAEATPYCNYSNSNAPVYSW